MAAHDTQDVRQLLRNLWFASFLLATANPKAYIILPIPLSNPNAYLLPIGYLATESITSVLANNAYVLKVDACKCESHGYLRRMQAEARKARVGVSESDLVEHAPWTMIEPIQPHVAGLFRFQATAGALASVFNGGEVLAGVVPASEIASNQFAKELIGRNSISAARSDIIKEALASTSSSTTHVALATTAPTSK